MATDSQAARLMGRAAVAADGLRRRAARVAAIAEDRPGVAQVRPQAATTGETASEAMLRRRATYQQQEAEFRAMTARNGLRRSAGGGMMPV